jgi:plastocyanin
MKWLAAVVLGVAVAAAIVLAAILQPRHPGTGGSANVVEIVATEMRFSPNRIDARVGQPVQLTIVNRGSVRHDLAFPSLEMPGLRGIETLTEAGATTRVTITFDVAGTYTFLCTIPGHAASGMTGAAFVAP